MPGTSSGISRPFIAGLLMLLFFLSLQTEWTPAKQNREGRSLTMQAAAPTASEAREAMKEKIILDLSLSNERLERENMRLKQHVLDLRRVARGCGCELNGTEAAAAAAYPELGRLLGAAEEAPVLAQGGPAAAAAPAPAPQPGGQTHRPERHRHHIPAGQDPQRRSRLHQYRRLLEGGEELGNNWQPVQNSAYQRQSR
ncbi:g1583 [Coccomyxa elongata]